MKKAFTLAEAVLTMTILGILAAATITTLKPNQYRQQAFTTLKRKVYANIDDVTQTVLTDCTNSLNLGAIFTSCNRSATTSHAFGTAENAIYALFMRGATGAVSTANGKCAAQTNYTSLALRNGVCLYFKATEILVDVNGAEGPNTDGQDKFTVSISNTEGVSSDMP